MLLGPSATTAARPRAARVARIFGGGLFALVGARRARARRRAPRTDARARCRCRARRDFGGIDAIGSVLFSDALVPFELSSALLMVAVVGAVAVARGPPGRALALEARAAVARMAAPRGAASAGPRDGVFRHEIADATEAAPRMIPVEHYVVAQRAPLRHRRRRLPRPPQRARRAHEHRADAQRGEPRARRVQPRDRATAHGDHTGQSSRSSSSPPRPPRSRSASRSSSRSSACGAPSARDEADLLKN